MVKHLPRHPKVKVSSPATAAGREREGEREREMERQRKIERSLYLVDQQKGGGKFRNFFSNIENIFEYKVSFGVFLKKPESL